MLQALIWETQGRGKFPQETDTVEWQNIETAEEREQKVVAENEKVLQNTEEAAAALLSLSSQPSKFTDQGMSDIFHVATHI